MSCVILKAFQTGISGSLAIKNTQITDIYENVNLDYVASTKPGIHDQIGIMSDVNGDYNKTKTKIKQLL